MDKVLLAARYVEGDLTDVEYNEFESILPYDKELQQLLQYYKQINRTFSPKIFNNEFGSTIGVKNVNNVLSHEQSYVMEEAVKVSKKINFKLFLGLTALVLTVVFLWVAWKPGNYPKYQFSNEAIVKSLELAPYPGFKEAATAFDDGQYYEAKQIIAKAYRQNPDDIRLANYYAMTLLATDCNETVKDVLTPVYNQSSQYASLSAYIMGLTYVKEGNHKIAMEWLGRVKKAAPEYNSSQELMSVLSN